MSVHHGHALPLEDLLELELLTVRSCDMGASWDLLLSPLLDRASVLLTDKQSLQPLG